MFTDRVAFVIYIALAFAQMAPFSQGIKLWGFGAVVGFIIFFVGIHLFAIGAAVIAGIAFYGAYTGWHWPWWQAAMLTIPFLIFGVITMRFGGLLNFYVRPRRR